MKKYLKFIIATILIMLSTICIFIVDKSSTNNVSKAKSTSTSDIQLMARAINGEARGEPYEGQVAVGAVILNRVKDSRFPNSISGVIYQPGAFTAVSDGQINAAIVKAQQYIKQHKTQLMDGIQQVDVCIILILTLQLTNGFGQDRW